MRILVTLKWCVDYKIRVHPTPDNKTLQIDRLKKAVNPFDEIALEQAIRFKENNIAESITVLSIGPRSVSEGLRYGLAMGADQAVLLETEQTIRSLDVAKTLQSWLKQNPHDMVLMGKQAIDSDNNQTGQMLASLLDWPQATFASSIEVKESHVEVTQEVDGGLHTVECQLPCLITADLRLNTPRYPSLPNIMKAKQKPLTTETLSSYHTLETPHAHIKQVLQTKQERSVTAVSDMNQLLDLLQTKEGVL